MATSRTCPDCPLLRRLLTRFPLSRKLVRMNSELARLGHPMLATLLAVSLGDMASAEEPPPPPPPVSPQPVHAQELELMMEEEAVSIASRYDQPISQAPSNVYVITDEDIRQSGATDLPTVLRRIPGLEVMQTTGADFNVSMRGDNQLNANKLLVMIDGRSIYFDVQGQVYWKAIPVTLPEIKRIEVLKGPASAAYGFNAFDGIINIITKSPEEMKGTTLQFGGGEYGTISSAAVHAGVQGNLGYRLSLGHDQNEQWRNRNALSFRANKFNAQTDYKFSDASKLSFSGGLIDVNRYESVVDVLSPEQQFTNSYTYVGYERPNFFIRGFWTGWNIDYAANANPALADFLRLTDQFGSSTWSAASNTYNIEMQHAIDLSSGNRFLYGLNYRHNTISCSCMSEYGREDRFGVYVQDEWEVISRLRLVVGARYDLDTFINPTISPRAAVIYQPASDHTFSLSASVAYRPPTITETISQVTANFTLPLPPPFNTGSTVAVGSRNLEPEKIVSYEAGYQGWYWKHRLRVRLNAFYNHITDLIAGGQSTGPTTVSFINAPGYADIYGGEAGVEFMATSWLSGFANYSYQHVNQTFAAEAQRSAPGHKFNVGLRGDWANGLSGEAAYHYYGAVTYPLQDDFANFTQFGVPAPNPRVGSYNLLNLRAGYKFWKQKASAGYLRDAEVAVSAFNALNDKHQEHPLGDTIGSRVMGWLTVRF